MVVPHFWSLSSTSSPTKRTIRNVPQRMTFYPTCFCPRTALSCWRKQKGDCLRKRGGTNRRSRGIGISTTCGFASRRGRRTGRRAEKITKQTPSPGSCFSVFVVKECLVCDKRIRGNVEKVRLQARGEDKGQGKEMLFCFTLEAKQPPYHIAISLQAISAHFHTSLQCGASPHIPISIRFKCPLYENSSLGIPTKYPVLVSEQLQAGTNQTSSPGSPFSPKGDPCKVWAVMLFDILILKAKLI